MQFSFLKWFHAIRWYHATFWSHATFWFHATFIFHNMLWFHAMFFRKLNFLHHVVFARNCFRALFWLHAIFADDWFYVTRVSRLSNWINVTQSISCIQFLLKITSCNRHSKFDCIFFCSQRLLSKSVDYRLVCVIMQINIHNHLKSVACKWMFTFIWNQSRAVAHFNNNNKWFFMKYQWRISLSLTKIR